MIINHRSNLIRINARKKRGLEKITGLIFKKKNTENIIFEFKRDSSLTIHSFFVFFPFLAIWLDKENKVLEWKIVNPFSFSIKANRPFRRILELPLNRKNHKIIQLFVGEQTFK